MKIIRIANALKSCALKPCRLRHSVTLFHSCSFVSICTIFCTLVIQLVPHFYICSYFFQFSSDFYNFFTLALFVPQLLYFCPLFRISSYFYKCMFTICSILLQNSTLLQLPPHEYLLHTFIFLHTFVSFSTYTICVTLSQF